MHQLKLNEQLICDGDLKSLTALFNDLSGASFARSSTKANWLDKMSSSEAYTTYLNIKAAEYKITRWTGSLYLLDQQGEALRVHLFDTHRKITQSRNLDAI